MTDNARPSRLLDRINQINAERALMEAENAPEHNTTRSEETASDETGETHSETGTSTSSPLQSSEGGVVPQDQHDQVADRPPKHRTTYMALLMFACANLLVLSVILLTALLSMHSTAVNNSRPNVPLAKSQIASYICQALHVDLNDIATESGGHEALARSSTNANSTTKFSISSILDGAKHFLGSFTAASSFNHQLPSSRVQPNENLSDASPNITILPDSNRVSQLITFDQADSGIAHGTPDENEKTQPEPHNPQNTPSAMGSESASEKYLGTTTLINLDAHDPKNSSGYESDTKYISSTPSNSSAPSLTDDSHKDRSNRTDGKTNINKANPALVNDDISKLDFNNPNGQASSSHANHLGDSDSRENQLVEPNSATSLQNVNENTELQSRPLTYSKGLAVSPFNKRAIVLAILVIIYFLYKIVLLT